MPWNPEQGMFPEASDIYSNSISRGNVVTVVGPSRCALADPYPLLAGVLAGQEGVVQIADPLEDPESKSRLIYSMGGPVTPDGSVRDFIASIEEFRKAGMWDLATYVWLGNQSGILHIPDTALPADVLIDHGTSQYVGSIHRNSYRGAEDFFTRVATTYAGALIDGGTALWQGNKHSASHWFRKGDREFIEIVKRALQNAGFHSVEHYSVLDRCRIPINPEIADSLRNVRINTQMEEYNCGDYVFDGCLYIDLMNHNCPDMFVARK